MIPDCPSNEPEVDTEIGCLSTVRDSEVTGDADQQLMQRQPGWPKDREILGRDPGKIAPLVDQR